MNLFDIGPYGRIVFSTKTWNSQTWVEIQRDTVGKFWFVPCTLLQGKILAPVRELNNLAEDALMTVLSRG